MPLIKDIGRGIKKVGRGAGNVIRQNPQLATRGLATVLTGMGKDPWGSSYGGEYRGFAHEAPEMYAKGERAGIEEREEQEKQAKKKRFQAFVDWLIPRISQGKPPTLEEIQQKTKEWGTPGEEFMEWVEIIRNVENVKKQAVKDKLGATQKRTTSLLDYVKTTGKETRMPSDVAEYLGQEGETVEKTYPEIPGYKTPWGTETPSVGGLTTRTTRPPMITPKEEEEKYTKGVPYINEKGERVVDVFDEQQNFVRQEAVGAAQAEEEKPTTFERKIKYMAEETDQSEKDLIMVTEKLKDMSKEDFMAKIYQNARNRDIDDDDAREIAEEAGRYYDVIYGLSQGEMPKEGFNFGSLGKWIKLILNPLAPLTKKTTDEESVESFIEKWSKGGPETIKPTR